MHRLVMLHVATLKLHTVPMRTISGMQQKFFWGMQPLDRHFPVLMKL